MYSARFDPRRGLRRVDRAGDGRLGRVGLIAELGVVQGKCVMRAVGRHARRRASARALQLGKIGVVGLVGRAHVRREPLWIGMEAEPAGLEQPGMLARERRRPGAASTGQLRSVAAVPLSGCNEPSTQYSARMKRSGTIPEKLPGWSPTVCPRGRDLADHDRVATMAGRLQRAPGRVEQPAVERGGDLDGRVVDRLRRQLLAVVGLVPDRPEVDPGQRGRRRPAGL